VTTGGPPTQRETIETMERHHAAPVAQTSRIAAGFLVAMSFATARGVDAPPATVRLFDTGTASAAPIAPEALAKRDGWGEVGDGEVSRAFKGDAAFLNNRLAVVLRRRGRGAEIHTLDPAGAKLRATLIPVGATSLSSLKIVRNDPSGVALEATYGGPDAATLAVRYELNMGQVFVRTEPRGDVKGLRVEAPCRFAVMPDFFADDIVVDAAELTAAEAELPSENFLIHLLGSGDALVMNVWSVAQEDVRITLSGQGSEKAISGSEILYGKGGAIWVGVLDGPGTWHTRPVAREEAGKEIRLDWKAPFAAQWRVDLRRDDGLTDSWEMLTQRPDGTYVKHEWFGQPDAFGTPDWMKADRKRWTTVLGTFQYPCWIDKESQGYLQPLKSKLRFEGPAVLYPINRIQETPLDRFTVVDVMRATLGVGPCEYILDLEGQRKEAEGIPTCASRSKINIIYASKQQKKKRAELEKALDDVLAFIRHIRGRIEGYVAFGHEMLAYLEEQKKAQPALEKFLAEMATLTRTIDAYVARRKNNINTPEHAAKLVEEFRATVLDYEGSDALAKCNTITSAFVRIGGDQDELVGECRMAVKILRQRAALAMAADPRTADVAREIRRRTHKMLRRPASYEAPRH